MCLPFVFVTLSPFNRFGFGYYRTGLPFRGHNLSKFDSDTALFLYKTKMKKCSSKRINTTFFPPQALKALREAAEKVRKHTQEAPAAVDQAPSGKGGAGSKEQRVETSAAFSEEDAAQSQVMLALGALLSSERSASVQVRRPNLPYTMVDITLGTLYSTPSNREHHPGDKLNQVPKQPSDLSP